MRRNADGKLTFGTKALFGSGEIVYVMSSTAISLYFLYYLTNVAGIAPVLAGFIFAIGRCWDALFNPLVGMFSDRIRTRWGRRRPFFLWTALPNGILFFLIWFPYSTSDTWLQMLCYTVTYVLFTTSLAADVRPCGRHCA